MWIGHLQVVLILNRLLPSKNDPEDSGCCQSSYRMLSYYLGFQYFAKLVLRFETKALIVKQGDCVLSTPDVCGANNMWMLNILLIFPAFRRA